MKDILEALEQFFEDDAWPINRMEGKPAVQMMFRGEHGEWMCYAHAREKDRQFFFYSVSPIKVPDDKRLAMAEFITRANYGLLVGNFEMDFSDGEVRYKTGFDVEKTELTNDLIRPAVYANVASMDKYLPGLIRVIYAEATPTEAIDQIEG
jgi:hypothetical protein